MNVAFCINRLGLIGLGVTISSMIRNCSNPDKITIWFLCASLNHKEKEQIKKLFQSENYNGNYHIVDFNPLETFGSFCSLHGDWTTYGRLLLAEIVTAEEVLYLDSDLVIEVDILKLSEFHFNGHALAAVYGAKFKHTLGNKFYINKLGISPEAEYFNAGVLLLNLKEWRLRNIKKQCLDIARKYPMELPSHDQSLLNIILAGNFAKLPSAFNCEWLADRPKPNVSDKMIIHFVGSPKPWDPFGFFIHNGYRTWVKYENKDWATVTGKFKISDISRIWNIRRSYIRSVLNRIKNN